MHGFADYTSATLWIQTDAAGPVEIDVAPDAGGHTRRISLVADAAHDYVLTVRVPGLAPGTAYRYRIAARGEVRDGVLRTQRYWNNGRDAAELTIAIGSCNYLANPDPVFRGSGGDYQIFDAIAARKPGRHALARRQRLPADAGFPRSVVDGGPVSAGARASCRCRSC